MSAEHPGGQQEKRSFPSGRTMLQVRDKITTPLVDSFSVIYQKYLDIAGQARRKLFPDSTETTVGFANGRDIIVINCVKNIDDENLPKTTSLVSLYHPYLEDREPIARFYRDQNNVLHGEFTPDPDVRRPVYEQPLEGEALYTALRTTIADVLDFPELRKKILDGSYIPLSPMRFIDVAGMNPQLQKEINVDMMLGGVLDDLYQENTPGISPKERATILALLKGVGGGRDCLQSLTSHLPSKEAQREYLLWLLLSSLKTAIAAMPKPGISIGFGGKGLLLYPYKSLHGADNFHDRATTLEVDDDALALPTGEQNYTDPVRVEGTSYIYKFAKEGERYTVTVRKGEGQVEIYSFAITMLSPEEMRQYFLDPTSDFAEGIKEMDLVVTSQQGTVNYTSLLGQ